MSDQKMTMLDKKLQEMALLNWPQFVQYLGEDAIKAAKICLLRQGGASYGEISLRLGVTKDQVQYRCNKCE